MSTLLRVIETGEEIRFHAEVIPSAESSNKVATHPVSGRAPSTDHVERMADTYDIQAVTTTIPIGPQVGVQDLAGQSLEDEVVAFLRRNQTRYFTVISSRLGVLTPLALTKWARKYANNSLATFDMSFQQVRYAEAGRTQLPPRRIRKKTNDPPKEEEKATAQAVTNPPIRSEGFFILGNNSLISPATNSTEFAQIEANQRAIDAKIAELGKIADPGKTTGSAEVTGAGVRNAHLPSGPAYRPAVTNLNAFQKVQ